MKSNIFATSFLTLLMASAGLVANPAPALAMGKRRPNPGPNGTNYSCTVQLDQGKVWDGSPYAGSIVPVDPGNLPPDGFVGQGEGSSIEAATSAAIRNCEDVGHKNLARWYQDDLIKEFCTPNSPHQNDLNCTQVN